MNLEQDKIFKVIEKNRFNEGVRVGLASSNKTIIEMAETKQDYLNENQRLTNSLLQAEDKIQELLKQPEQTLTGDKMIEMWRDGYDAGTRLKQPEQFNQDLLYDIEYLITAFEQGADANDYRRPISDLRDELLALKTQTPCFLSQ